MPTTSRVPRVYIAGTGQNVGKSTVCHGLLHAMSEIARRPGYMKPVSATGIDHVAFQKRYGLKDRPEDLNPILIESDTVRSYIAEDGADREKIKGERRGQVVSAFQRIVRDKDFVVIEGTGHSAVGYCFDLSNAVAATLLNSPVILVVNAGIGSTIDFAAPHLEYFRQKAVAIMGVIVNRVRPGTWERIEPSLRTGFGRVNIDLLGHLPFEQTLASATAREIGDSLKETHRPDFYGSPGSLERAVARYMLGTMPLRDVEEAFKREASLVIVPAYRTSTIARIASLVEQRKIPSLSGMVIVGKTRRSQIPSSVPFPIWHIASGDMETVVDQVSDVIHHGLHKIDRRDERKIATAHQLVSQHVDVNGIRERATIFATAHGEMTMTPRGG